MFWRTFFRYGFFSFSENPHAKPKPLESLISEQGYWFCFRLISIVYLRICCQAHWRISGVSNISELDFTCGVVWRVKAMSVPSILIDMQAVSLLHCIIRCSGVESCGPSKHYPCLHEFTSSGSWFKFPSSTAHGMSGMKRISFFY